MSPQRKTHSILSPRSGIWPTVALLMTVVALVSTGIAIWSYRQLAALRVIDVEPPVELEDRLVLLPTSFDELPGWNDDTLIEALPALRRSCEVFARRQPQAEIGPTPVAGTVADWSAACTALLAATDEAALRRAVESTFKPLRILNNSDDLGLFTGYYEPSLNGSLRRSAHYRVPLYQKPADLLSVDLEQFHERYAGKSISGRIGNGTFKPYFERAEIASGALADRRLELVWVDDPVDAFFLHIQGSGRVQLEDGSEMRVGYGGQNGRPYYAIGRELVDRGALALEEVSMQSIRHWLEANPQEAETVMSTNRSYVFFRELEGEGPLGTMGVALTPGRSMAIDRQHLPLGAPLWLDGAAPGPEGEGDRPLQRLLIAQDTGGAIKGPVRGDVFWGYGAEAELTAGHMKHEGRLWLLLPNEVAERIPQTMP